VPGSRSQSKLIGLALGGVEGDCTSTLGRTKISPVIVTDAPTAPEIGDKAVILGEAAFSWTGEQKITRSGRPPETTKLRAEQNIKADLSCRFATPCGLVHEGTGAHSPFVHSYF